ncbi:MAG: helix-turn-helix domain-containing protein [Candidatus Methanoculleus thermohydrogenotrophicum]|nr:helix-turn-helix domain-containing protein [Candidatus Methanoculleus thermohydrogenotrophicum]
MIVSYKYRAHLDAAVEARLHEALDTCRWLDNKLLEE